MIMHSRKVKHAITSLMMLLSISLIGGCSNLKKTHYGFESTTPNQQRMEPAVYWQLTDDTLSKADKQSLEGLVKEELSATMAANKNIYIQAKITQVDTVSPLLNSLSSVFLIMPFDRGGASIELQALDMKTGLEVLSESYSQQVSFSQYRAHFSRLKPAKIALTDAIGQFTKAISIKADNL